MTAVIGRRDTTTQLPPLVPAGSPRRMLIALTALLGCLAMFWLTAPENTGDALDYARDAARATHPGEVSLFEPGHLLWRPYGVVIRQLAGVPASDAPAVHRRTQQLLAYASMVAVVGAAILVGWLAAGLSGDTATGVIAALLTVGATVTVNYGQAGTSYLSGFALHVAALWCAVGAGPRRAIASGTLLAAGTLLWLPYVLAVPAGLVFLWCVAAGDRTSRWRAAVLGTVACAAIGIGVFLLAAAAGGVRSPAEFVTWLSGTSHGISRPGLARVALGLPRSFVHMGSDGREVRRFLVGDPLNAVSVSDLLRLPLWPKLAVFYAAIAISLWSARTSRLGRTLLLVLVLAAVPVVGLAASWSGGEEERYLPFTAYAVVLLAMAMRAAARDGGLVPRAVFTALAGTWLMNLWAMGPVVTREREEHVARRLGCATAGLDAATTIVVPLQGEPLNLFFRDRVELPPRDRDVRMVHLVPATVFPGLSWSQTLEHVVAGARAAGGSVLVPDYVLDPAPPRWAGWVEGGMYGVKWQEIRQAFGAYRLRAPCSTTGLLQVELGT